MRQLTAALPPRTGLTGAGRDIHTWRDHTPTEKVVVNCYFLRIISSQHRFRKRKRRFLRSGLARYVLGPAPMDLQFWPGAVGMMLIATSKQIMARSDRRLPMLDLLAVIDHFKMWAYKLSTAALGRVGCCQFKRTLCWELAGSCASMTTADIARDIEQM